MLQPDNPSVKVLTKLWKQTYYSIVAPSEDYSNLTKKEVNIMKDRVLYFLLGLLTMIVVYGFTQTTSKPTDMPSRTNPINQDIQGIKSEITEIKTQLNALQEDVDDIKTATVEIKKDTSQLDDIYMGVDAIGTELVSPVGGAEGIRADVNDIKSTVYSINTTVQRMETGRRLLFKNNFSSDTGD